MAPSDHLLATANIRLLFSGDEYYVHILEEIAKAQTSIQFESYIFELDPIGFNILSALERAVVRGVQVRLLVDGAGCYQFAPRLIKECAQRRISIRVYHPMFGTNQFWKNLSWRNFRRLRLLWRRVNKRNHRKIIVFDDRVVMMGSFNISQVHSETYMAKNVWRDSGLIATDFSTPEDIQNLKTAFFESWKSSKYFSTTNLKSFLRHQWKNPGLLYSRFRLNSRPNWRYRLLRDLNRKIKSAQKRVFITNAYFVPRKSILRNLRKVAKAGTAEVCLLLPEKTDIWFVREASRSLYRRLLLSGVRIFEYKNRILHAKTVIIDDWATVGSHNLNHRSFIHDLEAEAVLTEPVHVEALLQQWKKDLANSAEITLNDLGKWSWYRRVLSRLLYWFRYWI
jgi:cardiolipin synthase